jgi:hypothetical protein
MRSTLVLGVCALALIALTPVLISKVVGSVCGKLFEAARLSAELDAKSREHHELLRKKVEVADRVRRGELGLDEAARQFQQLGSIGDAEVVRGSIISWVAELTRGQPDREQVLRRLEREHAAAPARRGAASTNHFRPVPHPTAR